MKNILEELFDGNICPNEKRFDTKSEYAKLVGVISDNEEKLTAFLSENPKEIDLLSQLLNAQSEINMFNERERFIEGFTLGAGFMLDTFLIPRKSVVADI